MQRYSIIKKLNNLRIYLCKLFAKRSAKLIAAASLVAILAASTVATVSAASDMVVYVDGKAVCKVDSRAEYEEALVLLEALHVDNGVSDRSDRRISCGFKLASVPKASVKECADILFDECSKDYVRGYGISLNGIEIGFCATYIEAEKVVEKFREHIINSILESESDADLVQLTTDFDITSTICRADRISDADSILRTVLNCEEHYVTPDSPDASNKVVANGSLSLLYADKNFAFGMLKNEAETVLPEFDFSFNIGDLNSSIEYKTCVVEKYSELVQYQTVYIETDELYIGQSKVEQAGENGIAENVYEIYYVDGIEVEKILVSSTVISEPQNRIEYIGTKEYPTAVPTGSFMWPIQDRFVITSYFGVQREGLESGGQYHKAIDIAGTPVGTPIYAADGGTVTFAAESGTYGLLIKITHENGVETRYSHMDRLDVKVGDKVYKGQQIGTVGMTGRTTGPHLHFEVRINGNPVDPMKYLPSAKPWQD